MHLAHGPCAAIGLITPEKASLTHSSTEGIPRERASAFIQHPPAVHSAPMHIFYIYHQAHALIVKKQPVHMCEQFPPCRFQNVSGAWFIQYKVALVIVYNLFIIMSYMNYWHASDAQQLYPLIWKFSCARHATQNSFHWQKDAEKIFFWMVLKESMLFCCCIPTFYPVVLVFRQFHFERVKGMIYLWPWFLPPLSIWLHTGTGVNFRYCTLSCTPKIFLLDLRLS